MDTSSMDLDVASVSRLVVESMRLGIKCAMCGATKRQYPERKFFRFPMDCIKENAENEPRVSKAVKSQMVGVLDSVSNDSHWLAEKKSVTTFLGSPQEYKEIYDSLIDGVVEFETLYPMMKEFGLIADEEITEPKEYKEIYDSLIDGVVEFETLYPMMKEFGLIADEEITEPKNLQSSFRCLSCCITCPSEQHYQNHLAGKCHIKTTQLKKQNPEAELTESDDGFITTDGKLCCRHCSIVAPGVRHLQQHLKGKSHQNMMKKISSFEHYNPHNFSFFTTTFNYSRCKICNRNLTGEIPYLEHVNGKAHKRALKRNTMF